MQVTQSSLEAWERWVPWLEHGDMQQRRNTQKAALHFWAELDA